MDREEGANQECTSKEQGVRRAGRQPCRWACLGRRQGARLGGTPREDRSKARISQRQEGHAEGLVHWAVGI